MREIKFRAWDRKEKQWLPNFVNISLNGEVTMTVGNDTKFITDDVELVQYTGLKDKNGVEIYEGDILSDGFSKRYMRWVGAGFWLVSLKLGEQDIEPIGGALKSWGVVGNEYENK